MSIFRRMRISTKLMFTILPLLILAVGTLAWLNNQYQRDEMLKQAQTSAQAYAEIIRKSLVNMMTTNQRIDDNYLRQLRTVHDISEVHIHFSAEGLHLRDIYQDQERMDRLRQREEQTPRMKEEEAAVFRTGDSLWRRQGEMFKAVIPFKATQECRRCHDVEENHVLGAAEMNISLGRITASIRDNWIRSIWLVFIFTSLALVLTIALYRVLVAKRMAVLVRATKAIGTGDLEQKIEMNGSLDELAELAGAFETMRVRLKAAQDQAIHSERLATIGQMASSIVHDFRSPMSTINLAIEALQRGKNITPERTAQSYGLIRDSIHRMVSMAQELLDFSRGETRLQKGEFSVDDFLNLLVASISQNLEHSRIHLTCRNDYHGTAFFDIDRFHRALVNIINNAQDAMAGGGELSITVQAVQDSLCVTVSDTGPGIPPEIRHRIFDAFVTAGKKKGTGLGLAITKRIIDQHEGVIEVESERGTGTTFTIRIPLR
jgi:signal transduction histidine kinase